MSRQPLTWETVQPRYAAYCLAHGAVSPQEMMERDTRSWPGGKMAGFILWMNQRWSVWRKARNETSDASMSEADHAAFTDWLLGEAMRRVSPYPAPKKIKRTALRARGVRIRRSSPWQRRAMRRAREAGVRVIEVGREGA